MMIDAFQPEGITRLAVDSIFMMPQLGVLAQVNQEAATQVFERDCLVHLGTCIAPVGVAKPGDACLSVRVEQAEKETIVDDVPFGQLRLYPLGVGQKAQVRLQPDRRFDVGGERGNPLETEVTGGVVGLVVDTRGRPLEISPDPKLRVPDLKKWTEALNLYGAS